jgi:hypothetical protein
MNRQTVIIVGGSGGLSDRYRAIAEAQGLDLRHFERHLPARLQSAIRNIALVVVMTGMVSHPLREQAQRLALREGAPIVYLRTASLTALRRILQPPSEPPGQQL